MLTLENNQPSYHWESHEQLFILIYVNLTYICKTVS